MTPAERLRGLIENDPRPDREKYVAAGLSQSQFSQIKRGIRADPSLSTVAKVLLGLGLKWADLDE